MSNLSTYLFSTKAVRACEENKPFWLTSGKIGVYFINSEFLFGGETQANKFIEQIDDFLKDKNTLPQKVYAVVLEQYNINSTFKHVIDEMKNKILSTTSISEIDYISGGERRDWVFSLMVAKLLGKPHITLFKDQSGLTSDSEFKHTEETGSITGKKVLHVSDLITTASSYVDYWVPAITKLGGKMTQTLTVVDRMQGGADILAKYGVNTLSMFEVNRDLFKAALDQKCITEKQFEMIEEYMRDPDTTMRNFLIAHPEFLKDSLRGEGKTKVRVEKCLSQNLYDLPESTIKAITG